MSEPSFSNGFASPWYGGRMKYPGLWRGCVGSWAPLLGPTGATLFDHSGYRNDSPVAVSNWQIRGGIWNAAFGTATTPGQINNPFANVNAFSVFMWVLGVSEGEFGYWTGGSGKQFFSRRNPFQFFVRNGADTSESGCFSLHTLSSTKLNAVACVADGADLIVYVDGKSTSAPFAAPYIPGGGTLALGNGKVGDGGYAEYSEFSLFNRALSPSEITILSQRPGIMYELDDSDVWGAIEAGGSVPWWAFANRQSRIIGGGVA